MDVLITGGAGTVGTAITDHLAERDEYDFTSLDLQEHPDSKVDSVIADACDYDAVRESIDRMDAVIHLANHSLETGGPWERTVRWTDTHGDNIRIHANAIDAAVEAEVDSFIYASSNHAVGMYEVLNAPEIYYPNHGVMVDTEVPPRPDSMYGNEKVYAEGLARLAADAHGVSSYAIRIGAVRDPDYDHPYGDAERGVERGDFERGSDEYEEQAARMKGLWQSRRDLAHLVDRCLQDGSVDFNVCYGVSANDRRWFDIDQARAELGYDPQDNGDDWNAPPE